MVFLDFKSFLRFGFHIVKKMWPDARNPVSPTNFPKKIIGNRKPSSHAPRRFMTQILIADDHEIMRRGVRSVLESRRDVDVCEAENGVEAVQKNEGNETGPGYFGCLIGVRGYISKSEDIPSLLKAVEAALHNQTYFPS